MTPVMPYAYGFSARDGLNIVMSGNLDTGMFVMTFRLMMTLMTLIGMSIMVVMAVICLVSMLVLLLRCPRFM